MYDMPFLVESWLPENPDDCQRTGFSNMAGARAFACELARDGENVVILSVEVTYLARTQTCR